MRPFSAGTRLTLLAAMLAAAWVAFLCVRHLEARASALDRLEMLTLDLRFLAAGPRPPPPDLVLVAIDDATVHDAGAYPLPRDLLARLVEAIAAQRPKAIGIDLLFFDSRSPEADQKLAAALRGTPAVIGAAALFDPNPLTPGPFASNRAAPPRARQVLMPISPIREAAEIGIVNLSIDHGGTPRHVPMLLQGPDGLLPSFVLATASLASGSRAQFVSDRVLVGNRAQPLDAGGYLPLRFYGPRGTIPTVSAADLLRGGGRPPLQGAIVLIGATAIGGGDTFSTPFSPVVSGAEILATAVGNLVAGDGLVRNHAVRRADVAAACGLTLAGLLLTRMRRTLVGLGFAALAAAGWCGLAALAFMGGVWLSVTMPLAAAVPVALLHGIARLLLDRREAARTAAAAAGLSHFHPPQISERLARDPGFLASPVAQRAAVLFVDLSGFTALTERIGSSRTRDLLKAFHSIVDEAVSGGGGFVVSFMGDGAMALFGFPEPRPDDAARAAAAAAALEDRLRDWSRGLVFQAGASLPARIGIHFGPVVVSRLGGASHQHITATGDTVNVTSRLLEIAKEAGASMVITEPAWQAAAAEDPRAVLRFGAPRSIGIRGRVGNITVRTTEAEAPPGMA